VVVPTLSVTGSGHPRPPPSTSLPGRCRAIGGAWCPDRVVEVVAER